MSTGLSYEPRAAAKNCYTCFGEAWHAVRILATATCGGRRLGPVALFEGGSDCSTSVPVARAAMAGARRSPARPRAASRAVPPRRRPLPANGTRSRARGLQQAAPDAAPGAGAPRGGVLYPIILALAQSAGSRRKMRTSAAWAVISSPRRQPGAGAAVPLGPDSRGLHPLVWPDRHASPLLLSLYAIEGVPE